MLKKKYLFISLFTLLSLCISSCGFRLQGSHQALPAQLQQVYVDSSNAPHSAIAPELRVALESNNVTCVNDPNQARITLNIVQDQQTSHQIGSGASQETRKYELTYSAVFTLLDQTGQIIYGPAAVSSSSVHYVYSGQVLGNNQEESTLYQALRRNVIQKIVFKLSSDDVKTALLKMNGQAQGAALLKMNGQAQGTAPTS